MIYDWPILRIIVQTLPPIISIYRRDDFVSIKGLHNLYFMVLSHKIPVALHIFSLSPKQPKTNQYQQKSAMKSKTPTLSFRFCYFLFLNHQQCNI